MDGGSSGGLYLDRKCHVDTLHPISDARGKRTRVAREAVAAVAAVGRVGRATDGINARMVYGVRCKV